MCGGADGGVRECDGAAKGGRPDALGEEDEWYPGEDGGGCGGGDNI